MIHVFKVGRDITIVIISLSYLQQKHLLYNATVFIQCVWHSNVTCPSIVTCTQKFHITDTSVHRPRDGSGKKFQYSRLTVVVCCLRKLTGTKTKWIVKNGQKQIDICLSYRDILFWQSVRSVSYTHLDVYKRQNTE